MLKMSLVRLVYTSSLKDDFGPNEVNEILKVARAHNAAFKLTGALAFNNRRFLQCIEGPSEDVNALYARIIIDRRHFDVTLLSYETISMREFTRWSMGYVPFTNETRNIVLKYGVSDQFKFIPTDAASALGLLKELSNSISAL